MSYLVVTGLLCESGLDESVDGPQPVDPPELPSEVLLSR